MSKIVPIIFLVISGLLFFFVIDPIYNGDALANQKGIKDIRQEKAAYEDVLTRARSLQEKRNDLQKRYNAITDTDKSRLEMLLPDTLDNVRLVLDIDQIANRKNLNIQNISVNDGSGTDKKAPTPDEKGFGSATITFSVAAPYDVFVQFLSDLEDGLRLIDVTALSIDTKNPLAYSYTVTFKTYWLKK